MIKKKKLNLGKCCLNMLAYRSDLSRPFRLLSGMWVSALMRDSRRAVKRACRVPSVSLNSATDACLPGGHMVLCSHSLSDRWEGRCSGISRSCIFTVTFLCAFTVTFCAVSDVRAQAESDSGKELRARCSS